MPVASMMLLVADSVFDVDDISLFIAGSTSSDPIADLNGDGVFNLQDVQAFIASFTAGCP